MGESKEGIPVESKTIPPTGNAQYSGRFLVNETYNGELFYWFFQTSNASAPIIVWLEGGPGIPSSFQIFYGMGPYRISKLGKVTYNNETWNNNFSLLFIDNPLGVGFSYVEEGGFAVNEEEVASTLYTGLTMFFNSYPQYASNDVYIFGESYGGKYVPSLSYFIYQMQFLINSQSISPDTDYDNQLTRSLKYAAKNYYFSYYLKHFGDNNNNDNNDNNKVIINGVNGINMKGLGIGDGLVDTPVQIQTLADFAYFHGLSSLEQYNNIVAAQNKFQSEYNAGLYLNASNTFWRTIDFIEFGDHVNIYNVDCSLSCGLDSYTWGAYSRFLNQSTVKEQLNVPVDYSFNYLFIDAYNAINNDVCKSVSPLFPSLLSNFPVLLYQGTLDLICNAAGNDLWLSQSSWSGMSAFQDTKKESWFDGFNVAGYVRSYSNLTQIVLPNAGHFVPMDQPYRANLMVYNWINNIPFQTTVIPPPSIDNLIF